MERGQLSEITGSTIEAEQATVPWIVQTTTSTIPEITTIGSTVDIRHVSDFINLMKSTGGTVSILGTNSTVPVSFLVDTTSTRPVTFITPISVTATDLDIRDLSSATDSVTAHQSGTWDVWSRGRDWTITETVTTTGTLDARQYGTWSLSTTSTIPVSSRRFIDSAGTLYDQALVDTSKRMILGPTSTVQVSGTIGEVTSIASTIGAAVEFPTTSTVGVSWAPTGTQDIAIAKTITLPTTTASTISTIISSIEDTTSTRPVSFATTSTVQAVSAPGTGSTMEVRIYSRQYTSTQLITDAIADAGTSVTSDWFDIRPYTTKTVSCIISDAAGTLEIQVTPESSTATPRSYYTDNSVSADTFTTKSFTETFYWCRVVLTSGTANSTLNAWLGGQT